MYLDQVELAAGAGTPALLDAARRAAAAIPPAFPLDATVAVNPFVGQSGEDLATAAARLRRVAGTRIMMARFRYAADVAAGAITSDDLAGALAAARSPHKPADVAELLACLEGGVTDAAAVPSVADLAAAATGADWPAVLMRTFGAWASSHFDRGQALWIPAPGQTAFVSWRAWASRDLTPEIAGLSGFCAHVAACPDTPERAILRAAGRLGIESAAAEGAFHRLLCSLGGWAQHARWLGWRADLEGRTDTTLIDLLAIRLVWEEALMAHAPGVSAAWAAALKIHAEPVEPSPADVVDAILQDAAERAEQRRFRACLDGPVRKAGRPALQAVFCIDVRSEVYRRALELVDPTIETHGFAGFFGLPVAYRAAGSDAVADHLPVLLAPSLRATNHGSAGSEAALRVADRTVRAWGRFRQAAVSSFAFVEAVGLAYAAKLLRDSVRWPEASAPSTAPRFDTLLAPDAKAATAAGVLKAMGLMDHHARLVLLIGHGAGLRNNPHRSAYQCGACGGQSGEVSARLLASLLNDPETRQGLARHGIRIPADTLFVGGLHDTATDVVTLYPDHASPTHAAAIEQAKGWLARASAFTRTERARRLPGGGDGPPLLQRARNWAETRPEWGLAGCSAFVAAPRCVTAGKVLDGRAFLHSYDWRTDHDFKTLELIMTAPVVVASWISLQYYASAVAPDVFGSGNKLIHNVVGGLGVLEGNGGNLRTGLPRQAVHDGERLVHQPLRLAVYVEAPLPALNDVLASHPQVRDLFDNGWLHLFALRDGRAVSRYSAQGWSAVDG